MRNAKKAIESFIFPFDGILSRMHALLFLRFRRSSLATVLALYAALMLLTGRALGVSSNYFVLGPIVAAALAFGTPGGLVAGILALPANLLFFGILGHPEFSPASKVIAGLSGAIVGFLFGRLADYFRDVEKEIRKRLAIEEALRGALAEKELLLRELNHRVKNNLNVIKSLVQLQRARSGDPAFQEAADELIGRIFAMALAHDQLHKHEDVSAVDPERYIAALVGHLASALGFDASRIGLSFGSGGRLISIESAISLGLIVNEALTNALKHASPGRSGAPSISLSLALEGDDYRLEVCDDGPGPGTAGMDAKGGQAGLGLALMGALARGLGGKASLTAIEGPGGPAGARFELRFPSLGRWS
jgi:two-component sensor histidine kinase